LILFIQIQLFSEFERFALAKKKSNSIMITPSQRVVFLIQDWANPKEHSFGSQGGKGYIDNYPKEEGEDEESRERGRREERRRQIRQLFSKVDCYLMPKAREKIQTNESDFNSSLSSI